MLFTTITMQLVQFLEVFCGFILSLFFVIFIIICMYTIPFTVEFLTTYLFSIQHLELYLFYDTIYSVLLKITN